MNMRNKIKCFFWNVVQKLIRMYLKFFLKLQKELLKKNKIRMEKKILSQKNNQLRITQNQKNVAIEFIYENFIKISIIFYILLLIIFSKTQIFKLNNHSNSIFDDKLN